MQSGRWRSLLFLLCVGLIGCSRAPAGPGAAQGLQTPEEQKSNAMAMLRDESPGFTTYRGAVQILNNYVDQQHDLRAKLVLSEAERKLIRNEVPLDDTPRRLEELERKSFTSLDTYHLDACLLFRDAARSLKTVLGPEPSRAAERDDYRKELALLTFNWMVRQVELQPRIRNLDDPRAVDIIRRVTELGPDQLAALNIRDPNDALGRGFWPAHDILRRGTGDAEERARVLLALFDQLGFEAGVVTRTIEVQNEDKREQRVIPWVVGVRFGHELLLFDPLLGKPVAGPSGEGVATLRQARTDPLLLKAHYESVAKDPALRTSLSQCQYDASQPIVATAAQLAKPGLYLLSNLSALAPRMRELQGWLDDSGSHAVVHEDLPGRLETLRQAGLDVDVSVWRSSGGYPTVILAKFQEDPLNEIRRQAMMAPRTVHIPEWVRKLAAELRSPDRTREMFSRFDTHVLRIRLDPGGVRDLLVRGRPELAVEKIIETAHIYDKSMESLRTNMDSASLNERMRKEWGPQAVEMVKRLNALRVQLQKAQPNSEQARQLTEQIRLDEKQFNAIWGENRLALSFLTVEWTEPLVREHLIYLMGLAKLELAVRAEMQAARNPQAARQTDQLTPVQRWESAQDWFERYQAMMLPQPRNEWGAAVQRHLGVCRKARARLTASSQPGS